MIKYNLILFFVFILFSMAHAQTLSIDNIEISEGNTGVVQAVFTVTRSGDLEKTSTVKYQTANETAASGKDYEAKSGTLVFGPDVASQNISVLVYGDTIHENDETFVVSLSTPTNASISNGKGIATIKDDDAEPTVSIQNLSIKEANVAFTACLNVILSQESKETIMVQYQTEDDTATSPADYQAKSGTLTFNPGATSLKIPITVAGDSFAEPDEQFKVKLKDPTNATLGNSTGICTILNDDTNITGITIDDPSIQEGTEGRAELTFTVRITEAISQTCSVNFATADGTAKVESGDYRPSSGTVVFEPNDKEPKSISVIVNSDKAFEPDETLYVNLSNPKNGILLKSKGTGKILNDDEKPQISISDTSVNEPNAGTTTNATFVVSLSAVSYHTITVKYKTENQTATAPGDYKATSGTLTFAPGVRDAKITVVVNGDKDNDPTETFVVNLSGETNATIADNQGVGTIKVPKVLETSNSGDFSTKTNRQARNQDRENANGKPGTDSDSDLGYVRYQTPSKYKVAFKSVAYQMDDTTKIYLFNKEKLSDSIIAEFVQSGTIKFDFATLKDNQITSGHYCKMIFEIYYYQLRMPIHGQTRNVRVYMSDDDFSQEGNLGHHQGDILYVDDSENILGWVNSGDPAWWQTTSPTRNSGHNGAGGVDPQTGHSRGFFGDQNFWNASKNMQGASQDIFYEERGIDLTIPEYGKTKIIILHCLKNLWFFEDFDWNQEFTPGGQASGALYPEAGHEGAEWAPFFPKLHIFKKPNDIEKEKGQWRIHIQGGGYLKFKLDLDGVISNYEAEGDEDKTFSITSGFGVFYDSTNRSFTLQLHYEGGESDGGYTEEYNGTVHGDNTMNGTWERRGSSQASGNFDGTKQ